MRTAISPLDLQRPGSLEEALRLLGTEPRTPLAGATDLYVALNFGTLASHRFLDLHRLEELRTIELRNDRLIIGGMVTFTRLIRDPRVAERLPMLIQAARQIGGVQIQNRGTLGGNIANASPAGDSLPVLLAAQAVIVLRSAEAERRIPFDQFHTGYRTTVMRPDELIVAVEIPPVRGRQYFRKVGTRAAQAISKLVMAGVHGPEPRIAFGSVGPVPLRLRGTEHALRNGDLEEAVHFLEREISPIDDVRSTAAYRRTVAGNLLREFWTG
jgi:xanthine dehydrogenase small subunit